MSTAESLSKTEPNRKIALLVVVVVTAVASAAGQDYCRNLPLPVREALKKMPDEMRIPCDAEHIVVIRDLHTWVVKGANGKYDTDPSYKKFEKDVGTHMAFTFGHEFPIYLNVNGRVLDSIDILRDRAAVATLSCVLVHERIHALGELRESVAYQSEFDCIKTLDTSGYVPHMAALEIEKNIEQWRDSSAKKEETETASFGISVGDPTGQKPLREQRK